MNQSSRLSQVGILTAPPTGALFALPAYLGHLRMYFAQLSHDALLHVVTYPQTCPPLAHCPRDRCRRLARGTRPRLLRYAAFLCNTTAPSRTRASFFPLPMRPANVIPQALPTYLGVPTLVPCLVSYGGLDAKATSKRRHVCSVRETKAPLFLFFPHQIEISAVADFRFPIPHFPLRRQHRLPTSPFSSSSLTTSNLALEISPCLP